MGSDLELSEVWRELQRVGHVKSHGVLVQSCEKELIELMRQLDIMTRGKRIEWSNEKAVLNMRIESKERECVLQQECIEKRDKEIGQLKEKITNSESNTQKLMSGYQNQIEQLRSDLNSLKKHYDRLKSKYNKEKVKQSSEKRDNTAEIWAQDKRLLQKEVERLSSQMTALVVKCSTLEKGITEEKPSPVRDLQADADSLRDEIYRLKSELHESEDREAERSVEIARLKSDLSHWKLKSTKYSQELQSRDAALKKANIEINNLRRKSDHLARDLKAHDNALDLVVEDQSSFDREILRLKDIIQERDSTIKTLLEKNHLDESSALDALKHDLIKVDQQNREMMDRECKLKVQIDDMKSTVESLNDKLLSAERRSNELETLLQLKDEEVSERESHIKSFRDKEVKELQGQIHALRDTHSIEKSALEAELDSLKQQLTEAANRLLRPAPIHMISMLSETTSRSATPVDLSDSYNSHNSCSYAASAELKVTQRQLDAVRLENKHLKEQIVMSSMTKSDMKMAEGRLSEIENKHMSTVKQLQSENDKLKHDMQLMREELQKTQEIYHNKYQAVLKEMLTDIARREERLTEDQSFTQVQVVDKYSTPATHESGYRSALTLPSTAGKEKITPLSSSVVRERRTSTSSLYKERRSEASEDLREEARRVKQLIEDDNNSQYSYSEQSYTEATADSTRLDDQTADRTTATHDHTASEYMSVAPFNKPAGTYKPPQPPFSPVRSVPSDYLPPLSPTNSFRSTSTKKSTRSSRGHSRRSLHSLTHSSADQTMQSEKDSDIVSIRSERSCSSASHVSQHSMKSTSSAASSRHSRTSSNKENISKSSHIKPDHVPTLDLSFDQRSNRTYDSRDDEKTPVPDISKNTLNDSINKYYYASSLAASQKSEPSVTGSVLGMFDNSHFSSRPASSTAKFMEDQKQRTSTLEQLLDKHIVSLGTHFNSSDSFAPVSTE